jgi:hypothetical protein
VTAFFSDDGGVAIASVTSPPGFLAADGAWTHVALSVSASGGLRLYKNGALAASGGSGARAVPLATRPFAFLGLALDLRLGRG